MEYPHTKQLVYLLSQFVYVYACVSEAPGRKNMIGWEPLICSSKSAEIEEKYQGMNFMRKQRSEDKTFKISKFQYCALGINLST